MCPQNKELTQLCGEYMLKKPFRFSLTQKGRKIWCIYIACENPPLSPPRPCICTGKTLATGE